ncbi:MAG: 1-acyl-sn-glycerol-3-phosphate acyltransferase [bacterium]|nr:1-acyl-sn-glycerol-3-phosphate acyltransferase [bacterium]
MREVKPLFTIYQGYKYLVYYPLLGFSTSILTILSIVLLPFNVRAAELIGVIWARFNSVITPMSIQLIGKEKIDNKQSYVIVANHQSQYDIFVVYGWLPINFKWVMKAELRKVPFLGYYCDSIGHVFINRLNSGAAHSSINSAKERIQNGTSILFFSEGKRSETGELLSFKKGAFKLALDMGLPILPVTIVNTRKVLPNNSTALFPGKAKLVIHDPISIDGYTEDSIDQLIHQTKGSIKNGLNDNGQHYD